MDMAKIEAAWEKLGAAEQATIEENLKRATGGAARTHALRLMAELAAATGPDGPAEDGDGEEAAEARIVAALEAAMALAPRDPLEGMLAVQMTAVHAAALRCLARAAACTDHPQIEARYLREAARLLHLYTRQGEALDRRARRFGRKACSCHAPPSAGLILRSPEGASRRMAPGARHRIHDPMPMAARGPGEACCGIDPDDDPEAAEILEIALDAVRKDLGLPKPARRWDGKPKRGTGAREVPRPPAAETLRQRRARAGGGKGRRR